MRQTVRYGYVRDRLDPRDVPFLPGLRDPSSDLRSEPAMPDVYNQGEIGSCTANASGGDYEYLLRREGLADFLPSRLYIYYNTRLAEGTQDKDSGASIRDSMKALATAGVCSEGTWPYVVTQVNVRPSGQAYLEALKHIELEYQRIDDSVRLDAIRTALSQKLPVVFGVTLFQQFEELGSDGQVQTPNNGFFHRMLEPPIGDHAMLIVGHDDQARRLIVRNSWGKSWGQEGYCFFPYDYLGSASLASDFWVGKKVS